MTRLGHTTPGSICSPSREEKGGEFEVRYICRIIRRNDLVLPREIKKKKGKKGISRRPPHRGERGRHGGFRLSGVHNQEGGKRQGL